MKLHVEVTQDDIDNGVKCDAIGARGGCMIYRAFQRATEGAFPDVAAGPRNIVIFSERSVLAKLPHDHLDQMLRFDAGHHVSPFVFDLELPDSLFMAQAPA